jgi:hypothetical protein
MRHTAGFAADGGKVKHVEAPPVPSQLSPGLGMEGLLLPKWLVRHCALADQAWAVRPQAAPLVPASESAVEVEEGDLGHAAPADKGLPPVWCTNFLSVRIQAPLRLCFPHKHCGVLSQCFAWQALYSTRLRGI